MRPQIQRSSRQNDLKNEIWFPILFELILELVEIGEWQLLLVILREVMMRLKDEVKLRRLDFGWLASLMELRMLREMS